ncbi:MAG: hypothetical protein N2645_15245 [Clostridia bacterium]|nr:hypothetical protein [Clostridia bacterium]
MNKNDYLVRKDLYEIYTSIYNTLNFDSAKEIYSTKLISKFKYPPSEVAKVLEIAVDATMPKNSRKKSNTEIQTEISNISCLDALRDYYYKNLARLFNADIDEDTSNKILSSLNVGELKYLYSLISPIPIKSGKTKKEIIYMFKYYFDDEARTDAMTRNLK